MGCNAGLFYKGKAVPKANATAGPEMPSTLAAPPSPFSDAPKINGQVGQDELFVLAK